MAINVNNKDQSGGVNAGKIGKIVVNNPSPGSGRWIGIATLVFVALGALGAVGLKVFRDSEPKPAHVTAPKLVPLPTADGPLAQAPPPKEVKTLEPETPRHTTKHRSKNMGKDKGGDVIYQTNIGQSGGVAAGKIDNLNVYNQPPQRHVTAELGQGLLSIGKVNPVRVFFLNNDSETVAFSTEIHRFLKQNGYKLAEANPSYFMSLGPAQSEDVGVNVNARSKEGPETWVTVRPR
jgi:hypothetical protein